MAGADTKVSQITETTTISGFIHKIESDGLGGFNSRRISDTNYLKDVTDRLDALELLVGQGLKIEQKTAQTIDFTFDILNTYKLESIDIRVVSNGQIKVGTSALADDIMPLFSVTTASDLNFPTPKTWPSNKTLFFTVTGSLNINISYRENQF